MNKETARTNMIKQQFRTCDILDPRVLALSDTTPRECFVPPAYQGLAFSDTEIPIGHEQVMLRPTLEMAIIQALQIKKDEKILEIGTGSGYMTALLANSGQHVYSIDIIADFTHLAGEKLAKQGIDNVTLATGNGAVGWPKNQLYDIIVITGGLPFLPNEFQKELKIGGRLFAVLGHAPVMHGMLITRQGEDQWQRDTLFETVIPYLRQTANRETFKF